jgi:hypothetical protein
MEIAAWRNHERRRGFDASTASSARQVSGTKRSISNNYQFAPPYLEKPKSCARNRQTGFGSNRKIVVSTQTISLPPSTRRARSRSVRQSQASATAVDASEQRL